MDVVRRFNAVVVLSSVTLALAACGDNNKTNNVTSFENTSGACAATAVPNQFIVNWKDGSVTREDAEDRETFIREFLDPQIDDIDFAEHEQRIKLPRTFATTSTAVPAGNEEWGQSKTGVADAWAQGIQGQNVIVAVVDSGVDIKHPQLYPQIAVNVGEIPLDGIDNDGNGLIDDYYGYDFQANSGAITDGAGHGTHVAGTILADPSKGVVKGVAPQAKLLPLDFMSGDGGSLTDAISAINYAVARGAKVINASWGGAPCSKSLQKTIASLEAKNVLFIAASGNGDEYGQGVNLDTTPTYPAAYVFPGQLTVGASTIKDSTAGFSNFSYSLVHLVAPGTSILSTYPNNSTRYLDGTSMATPFVSGAAALLWSHRPQATVAQIRAAILNGVDKGYYQVSTRGRLNIRKSLEELVKLLP